MGGTGSQCFGFVFATQHQYTGICLQVWKILSIYMQSYFFFLLSIPLQKYIPCTNNNCQLLITSNM